MEFLLQAVDYEKLSDYKYDTSNFNLNNMEAMLSAVGDPHKKGEYVHIGGTKGKGSTAIMIASVLKESGLKTGLFTSPHLEYLGERMQINGRTISQKALIRLINEFRPYIERERLKDISLSPTFFEIVTAIALIYFERKKTDISVLEVGMGGRLDSTNVVSPRVSVITTIEYDHTDKLGNTLEKIAYEKAGIIKKGVSVISSMQEKEVLAVISRTCKQKKARLFLVEKDIAINNVNKHKRNGIYGTVCDIRTWRHKYNNIFLPVVGRHQVENCAAAIGALEVLSENNIIKTDKDMVQGALAKMKCPARIEVISRRPLIILDTAHTVSSMQLLKKSIKENFSFNKLILVIGLSSDKDIEGILSEITDVADKLIFTRTGNPREAEPKELAEVAGKYYRKGPRVIEKIDEALQEARRIANKDDLVCITGSFYLAARVKEAL